VRLSRALRLRPGQTVAFTGAGGKSAALGRLASEASLDLPVLLTTTTHLSLEQSALAPVHIVMTSADDLFQVEAALDSSPSLLVTGPQMESEPRWTSPGMDNLEALRTTVERRGGVLAVEADGSRQRSIKAPAEHEPLVPDFTNTLVPVTGASAIGQPLNQAWVHRPERVAAVLGIPEGDLLTPEDVARLMMAPQGGLKGRPPGSEVRALVQQVDDAGRQAAAERVADLAMAGAAIRAVGLASSEGAPPFLAVHGRVGAVILAAGGSRRFGRPKLLESWKGEPIIRHVVRAAVQAGLSPIVLVVGDQAEGVSEAAAGWAIETSVNGAWAAGQSGSMRLGLARLRDRVEASVFMLGDMPMVQPRLIRRLVERHRMTLAPVIVPWADGRRGNPALFDRATFEALDEITGDTGGRAIVDRFELERVDWEARDFFDLDTPRDLDQLAGLS
jgi:molybdenum cofactor cytidylyltransferase